MGGDGGSGGRPPPEPSEPEFPPGTVSPGPLQVPPPDPVFVVPPLLLVVCGLAVAARHQRDTAAAATLLKVLIDHVPLVRNAWSVRARTLIIACGVAQCRNKPCTTEELGLPGLCRPERGVCAVARCLPDFPAHV